MRHASRTPRWLGEWPTVLVLGVAAAGVLLVALPGVALRLALEVLAAAPALGAVLRAVLPSARAGLLRVRARAVDVVLLAAAAVGVLALVLATPTSGR
ncbi:DUF3017 family protein [Motilibacter rhizosphaerae]|uniref:DUF3017 family protein n=1 Tax=Motilibacter rhizosphaerae TaxID=598652 RepID=A0A4Q7NT32_9ACTN|nr:DUF3017 domain-containing protein [Motilibacter rhizosphaerae]RZS90291.1 DUF3017 family protein [Motilibacter rhizosphaerae]